MSTTQIRARMMNLLRKGDIQQLYREADTAIRMFQIQTGPHDYDGNYCVVIPCHNGVAEIAKGSGPYCSGFYQGCNIEVARLCIKSESGEYTCVHDPDSVVPHKEEVGMFGKPVEETWGKPTSPTTLPPRNRRMR